MSSERPPSLQRADGALTLFLLAIFLVVSLTAYGYSAPARTVPLMVGIAGAVLCVVQFLQLARSRPGAPGGARADHILPRAHRVMFAWFVLAVALVVVIGVLAATVVFVSAFLVLHERERLWRAVGSAVTGALVLYLVLERAFGLPLYGGVLAR